jgi:hypothetical protein
MSPSRSETWLATTYTRRIRIPPFWGGGGVRLHFSTGSGSRQRQAPKIEIYLLQMQLIYTYKFSSKIIGTWMLST